VEYKYQKVVFTTWFSSITFDYKKTAKICYCHLNTRIERCVDRYLKYRKDIE